MTETANTVLVIYYIEIIKMHHVLTISLLIETVILSPNTINVPSVKLNVKRKYAEVIKKKTMNTTFLINFYFKLN